MRRFPILFSLLLTLLVSACEQRSKGILSKGKMKEVLYDYHLAQAISSNANGSERRNGEEYLRAVFEKHGVTEAEFDSSLVWYNAHTDELKDIYKDLQERFTQENENLQLTTGNSEMVALISEGGDTTNLWNGEKVILLRNRDIQRLEKFTIKADTSFRSNDRFILSAKVQFLQEDNSSHDNNVTIALALRNKDGKTFSQVQQVNFAGLQQLNIAQASTSDISEISGFFYYQGKASERNLCIINNISLIRMHEKEEPAQPEPQDSVQTDTIHHDSLPTRQTQPRLSPEELREQTTKDNDRVEIKRMPDKRTPNSFGPRRRPVRR